jgi:hypothetical protein
MGMSAPCHCPESGNVWGGVWRGCECLFVSKTELVRIVNMCTSDPCSVWSGVGDFPSSKKKCDVTEI